jgi:SAM-dependent methyltransferase
MTLKRVSVHIEPWLESLFVDPVTHERLDRVGDAYASAGGFSYPVTTHGIPDFRIAPAEVETDRWSEGQRDFELWLVSYLDQGEADEDYHARELEADAVVYRDHPLSGAVLDVGGQMGFIRMYTEPERFASIDPFVGVPEIYDRYTRVVATYRLDRPLNFVGGMAEYLPFCNASFDGVNMRSCIDHFADPVRALCEAWRVLRPGGRLVIGNSYDRPVDGAGERPRWKAALRALIGKDAPDTNAHDHHIYNPKSPEALRALLEGLGFAHQNTTAQRGLQRVFYSSFTRLPAHRYRFAGGR